MRRGLSALLAPRNVLGVVRFVWAHMIHTEAGCELATLTGTEQLHAHGYRRVAEVRTGGHEESTGAIRKSMFKFGRHDKSSHHWKILNFGPQFDMSKQGSSARNTWRLRIRRESK